MEKHTANLELCELTKTGEYPVMIREERGGIIVHLVSRDYANNLIHRYNTYSSREKLIEELRKNLTDAIEYIKESLAIESDDWGRDVEKQSSTALRHAEEIMK